MTYPECVIVCRLDALVYPSEIPFLLLLLLRCLERDRKVSRTTREREGAFIPVTLPEGGISPPPPLSPSPFLLAGFHCIVIDSIDAIHTSPFPPIETLLHHTD